MCIRYRSRQVTCTGPDERATLSVRGAARRFECCGPYHDTGARGGIGSASEKNALNAISGFWVEETTVLHILNRYEISGTGSHDKHLKTPPPTPRPNPAI